MLVRGGFFQGDHQTATARMSSCVNPEGSVPPQTAFSAGTVGGETGAGTGKLSEKPPRHPALGAGSLLLCPHPSHRKDAAWVILCKAHVSHQQQPQRNHQESQPLPLYDCTKNVPLGECKLSITWSHPAPSLGSYYEQGWRYHQGGGSWTTGPR